MMEIPKFYLYSVGTAALLGTLIYLGLRCKNKRFRKIGRISKIILYPVKSLAGNEVEKAICTPSGLKTETLRDRIWLIVKVPENKAVTLMHEPRLVLLHCRVEDNQLIIDGEGLDPLKVDVITDIPIDADIQEYTMYSDPKPLKAVDCGEEAAKWLQKFLDRTNIRLVQFVLTLKPRTSTFRSLIDLNEDNYPVIFQSDSPYLLLSQPSVDDLNNRLEEDKVNYKYFRPNILLDDCKPFEEDKWKYLKIGDTVLIRTTPCDRCLITKINPVNGIRSKEEPIRTLNKYRLAKDPKQKKVFKKKPLFCMYYGLVTGGEIWVGDEVYGAN